jgi:hypothetical protein
MRHTMRIEGVNIYDVVSTVGSVFSGRAGAILAAMCERVVVSDEAPVSSVAPTALSPATTVRPTVAVREVETAYPVAA